MNAVERVANTMDRMRMFPGSIRRVERTRRAQELLKAGLDRDDIAHTLMTKVRDDDFPHCQFLADEIIKAITRMPERID